MYSTARRLIVACVLATLSPPALAEAVTVEFPSTWVNSPPLMLRALRGKIVALWFFEETCPSCRAKWPGLLAIADTFKDKPVLFVAVNSGNDAQAVKTYMTSVRCKWPTIVDTDRRFEKDCGLTAPISLDNVHHLYILTPEGKVSPGSWKEIPESVQDYMARAKWNVEPNTVPAPLKAAWRAFEFGDYTTAIPALQKAAGAADEATKTAAQKMLETIAAVADERMAAAKKDEDAGKKWPAYRIYKAVAADFPGHPKGAEANAAAARLGADPGVKNEVKAAAVLDGVKRQLSLRGDRRTHLQARASLEAIIKQLPETEAATIARVWIDNIPKN